MCKKFKILHYVLIKVLFVSVRPCFTMVTFCVLQVCAAGRGADGYQEEKPQLRWHAQKYTEEN